MSYGGGAGDNSDWESSFSQILNRTKHNLNRINQRYAPTGGPIESNILAPRGTINNENSLNQPSLLLDRFSKTDTYLQRPEPATNRASAGPMDQSILERLIRIEEQQRATENASNNRLINIEKSVENALNGFQRASQQMNDLEHSIAQLQNKFSNMNGFVEVLQNENDSKRNVISKMDHWIRQGEIWREDLDGKVDTLAKLTKSLDRTRIEQRELMSEHVTRFEMEQLRDKMTVVTQQTVAASLSAWHDKMEQSVRNVERQIALLRIGMTDSGRNTEGILLSQDEVTAALSTPLPSELLLKGTVANEVLQMENKLEEKLESRLQLFLKDKVDGSHNNLHRHLHQQLQNLCSEMGLDFPEVPGVAFDADMTSARTSAGYNAGAAEESGSRARENYRIRLLEARKKSDEEIQELTRHVERIRSELSSLQQAASVDQKHHSAVTANLERKVEESIAVSANSVNSVIERSSRLEDVVRQAELAMRTSITDTKGELIERISDLSRDWATERAGLDRRLLVNERIGEDCLDRIKLSQSAVESYFKASPDVKRFQRSTELVAQLQQQLTAVHDEVRTTSATVHKLEANGATKNEHLELRERVARMEPTVLEKLPDYMDSTKRVVDLSVVMQSRLDKLDTLSNHHHTDIQATISKLSAVDILATHLKGLTTVATEEIKRLTASVAEIDSTTRKDVNYLRDLTGSISSRVVAVEGKVNLMNKTYAADSVSVNNSIAKLKEATEELQAHDTTTQNTLVQLQWALEAGHREATDNHVLLKSRLDLLQQIQQQQGPSVYEAPEVPGKSIEIKFTTLGVDQDEDEGEEAYESTTYTNPAASTAVPVLAPTPASSAETAQRNLSFSQQNMSVHTASSVQSTSAASPIELPAPPAASKPAQRGGYSAFLTEASMSSSPEKSFNKSSFIAQESSAVEDSRTTSVASGAVRSLDLSNASVERSNLSKGANAVTNASVADFIPAREYSVEEPRQQAATTSALHVAEEVDEFDLLSDSEKADSDQSMRSGELSRDQSRADTSTIRAAPPSPLTHAVEEQGEQEHEQEQEHDNSWDESMQSPSHASPQRGHLNPVADTSAAADMSSSRIPMMSSAFDMSMPSYVSHIDSSGDANQSSFDYPYPGGAGSTGSAPSASDDGSQGQRERKLSIGSDDSLQNLNSTVDGLLRHRETVLDVSAAAPVADTSATSLNLGASTANIVHNQEAHDEADEHSSTEDESEGRSPDDSFSDEHSSDGSDAEDAGDDDVDSGPGSFSQIDGPGAATAVSARDASSAVENSWDNTSMLQSSFVSAASGTASNAAPVAVNVSVSSASTGPAKAAFKIPALNMSIVPKGGDEREPPSDRFSSRGAGMTNSGRQSMVSDWDGECSFGTDPSPLKPVTPRVTAPVHRATPPSAPSPRIPSLQSSVADTSVAASPNNRSRTVIGASQGSPAGRAAFDDSTGGSVSDTSSGSSYTASSSSYLTISSASPVKSSVAASATATAMRTATLAAAPAAAPVPTPAPAAADLNASKNLSIKERLRLRQEAMKQQKKNSDTASVSSVGSAPTAASVSGAIDRVESFEELDDSQI